MREDLRVVKMFEDSIDPQMGLHFHGCSGVSYLSVENYVFELMLVSDILVM